MQTTEPPRETILTISYENRALRWATVLLSLALAFSAAALLTKKPAPVWLVREDGTIFRGDKKVFAWEPNEATRRALDLFFTKNESRTGSLDKYFTGGPLLAAKEYQPSDRFVAVRVDKVVEAEKGAEVNATVMREGQGVLSMTLELSRVPRTEMNPFGLVVSSTTVKK